VLCASLLSHLIIWILNLIEVCETSSTYNFQIVQSILYLKTLDPLQTESQVTPVRTIQIRSGPAQILI